MNIPKGATLYNTLNQYYYKGSRPKLHVFIEGEWEPSVLEKCNDKFFIPIENGKKQFDLPSISDKAQTRQAIIDLAWKECGVQGDAIRQLATTLVNHGYRKFEIVEEDV